jgi:O-antigen/teichoic acid export membrane protein
MRVYEFRVGVQVFTFLSQFKRRLKRNVLFKNALYNSGSFFFASLIQFIALPYFIAEIGVIPYGIFVLVTSLFGYYGLFDLGLGQGLIKFVSERSIFNNQHELIPGIKSAFWFQAILSFLISILLFIYSYNIATILNVGAENLDLTSQAIKFASLGFFFSSIAAIFSSSLRGFQLYKLTAKIEAVNNTAVSIISILLLYFTNLPGLYVLVIVSVISSGLVAWAFYYALKKKILGFNLIPHLDFYLLKKFFKFSFHIFLSQISNLFANYIVKFLIGFYAGPAAVSYFSVPQKLLGAFGGLMSKAANTLMPHVSVLQSEGKEKDIKEMLLKVSFLFSAISIPVCLFISIYSNQILNIWLDETFAKSAWFILSITCISATIGSFTTIPNQVIIGIGNSKLLGHFSIITLILYLILLPLLTKYYLLEGAAFGLLITSSLLVFYVIIKVLKQLQTSVPNYFKLVFATHLIPLFVYVLINVLIVLKVNCSDIMKLLIGLFFVFLYYIWLWAKSRKFLFKLQEDLSL